MKLQLSIRGEKNYNITVSKDSTLVLENSEIISLGNESIISVSNSSNIIGKNGSSISGFRAIQLQNALTASFTLNKLDVDLISGNAERLELTGSNCSVTQINTTCQKIFIDSSEINLLQIKSEEFEGKFIDTNYLDANSTSTLLKGISSKEISINSIDKVSISSSNVESSKVYSPGNVTITDSIFGNLTVGLNGKLYNVTTSKSPLVKGGGMIFVFDNSTMERYWYLKVNVTDITGYPIPAKIEIYDHLENLIKNATADSKGLYYQPALAEIITNNTSTFVGNYRLRAYYNITEEVGRQVMTLDTISTEETLYLDSNKEVNLKFFDVILGISPTKISVNPTSLLAGDTLTVNGTIVMQMPAETIEIIYERPSGKTFSKVANTNEKGEFENQIKPDEAGTWKVYADWIGGASYLEDSATISRKVSFFVEDRATPLAIIIRIFPIFIIVVAILIVIALLFIRTKRIS